MNTSTFSAAIAAIHLFAVSASATAVNATYHGPTDVAVTAASYTATGNTVDITLNFTPSMGTSLTVINNTGIDFIKGRFANLAQGQEVTLVYQNAAYKFVANYYGGTGNDLVLQWAGNKVYVWGYGQQGQMGDGISGNNPVPGPIIPYSVLTGKTVTSLAAGGFHCLALCADGTLATWGRNVYGELGNNSTTDSSVPVDITNSGALAGKTVVATAGSNFFNLALAADGTVASWGQNLYGTLGNNTTTDSSVPVAVASTGVLAGKTVTAIAAGGYHSLALCSDGTLAAWGSNSSGQLGNSTTTDSHVPVTVTATGALAGKTVVAIAAGNAHSLALCADGTLAAWGWNSNGQLGNNATADSNEPVDITSSGVLAGKTVTAIAAGDSHNLVLCSDGTLVSWGANQSGQLGNSTIATSSKVPIYVDMSGVLAAKTVTGISHGGFHNLVLCADGTMAAWGSNQSSQFGNNTTNSSSTPVAVTTSVLADGEKFTMLAVGSLGDHSLALASVPAAPAPYIISSLALSSGTLVPGFNPATTRYSACVANATNSITVALTAANANAGITVNGVPVATGSSSPAIPLATGMNTITVTATAMDGATTSYVISVLRPTDVHHTYLSEISAPVEFPAYDATGITVDLALGCVPRTGATLTVVRNTGLEFISGRFANLAQGQPVTLVYQGSVYRFVANYYGGTGNDLVLQWATGTTYGWGFNMYGQTGIGSTSSFGVLTPTAISNTGVLAGKTVQAIAGGSHSLALCSDGTLAAWGWNYYGQLGNGTTNDSSAPLVIPPSGVLAGKSVAQIAAGASHSVVLCTDNTVATWGYNNNGQLGNGTTTNSSIPVAVSTAEVLAGRRVVAVAAGSGHNLALCSDGTVAAWGNDLSGQLGSSNVSFSSSKPVTVDRTGALSNRQVTAISAGNTSSYALCADGTVAAWGDNYYGQLGNGSTTTSYSPVAVTTSGALAGRWVVAVAAGGQHCLALCADGTLVAWGYNYNGQLGNNTTTNSSVPVNITSSGVLAGKTVVAISAEGYNSLALCADGTLAAWGYNYYGELGNNSNTDSKVPVAVSTTTLDGREKFMMLSAGSSASHTVAVTAVPLPYLSALSLGPVPFSPAYSPDTTAYSTVMPYAVDTVRVTPVTPVANATITVNGTSVASGGTTSPIPLAVGDNSIVINVSSPLGTSTSYVVTVTRAASMLTSLTPSSGTLSPAFASGTTAYSAGVHQAVAAVTLTPTSPNATDTIRVNGSPVASGAASDPIALTIGPNSISVTVTALDGSVASYTVIITRWSIWNVTFDSPTTVPLTTAGHTAGGAEVFMSLGFAPVAGTTLTLINVTGTGFIDGRIPNLAHGQIVTLDYQGASYRFVANYFGGTGNDLVLQWVGTVACAWGSNSYGQLGNDSTAAAHVPAEVSRAGVLSDKTPVALSAGCYHSLALCSDGTLAAWGNNTYGQLGNNTTTESHVPVAVAATGALASRTVIAIAAGYYHNLALCSDGALVAWGSNSSGQLGNNSTTNSSVPVEVIRTGALAGKVVTAIAAGNWHNLVLCSDGTLAAWGNNTYWQVGGSVTNSKVPNVVPATNALAGKSAVAIAAGGGHNLVLCADGSLAAWGHNNYGQLGDKSTTDRGVPVAVTASGALAGKMVKAIAAGDTHSLVLCADGSLSSWGANQLGQLGNNSTTSTSWVPVIVDSSGVLAGRSVVAIDGGYSHSMALCADGTVATWGSNSSGQLGITTPTSTSLVPVLADTTQIGAGRRFTCASGGLHSMALAAMPLPSATSLPASGFAGISATLNGQVNANDNAATVLFEYGTTSDYGNFIAGVPGAVTGHDNTGVYAAISGLTPGTTYHYRVVATGFGGVVRSGDMTFKANWPPVFDGYSLSTPYQTAATIALMKLLAKASDPAGDAITVTAAGPASAQGGAASLSASGILYTPPAGFTGTDTFTVALTDTGGATTIGTVTVTVGPAPTSGGAATTNPPQITVQESGAVSLKFLGIPGRTYQIQRSTDMSVWATIASVTANTTGAITFTDDNPPQPNAFYRLALP